MEPHIMRRVDELNDEYDDLMARRRREADHQEDEPTPHALAWALAWVEAVDRTN